MEAGDWVSVVPAAWGRASSNRGVEAEAAALVLTHGIARAAGGALLGLAGAVLGTRLLQGLLFNVGTTDPAVIVVVTATLIGVALLASYVPARISPLDSLRSE